MATVMTMPSQGQGQMELWLTEPVDWCVDSNYTCQIAISVPFGNASIMAM